MSNAKTERLVNLTMALLASRRFVTKSEIFRRVAGYSGSQETKERMFERDKDDLRALGIEIEVGGHDPAFEDEPGYRISPERYQLPSKSFTSTELGLISVALNLWRGSAREDETDNVLRRFQSLGVTVQHPQGLALQNISIDEAGLTEITEALAARQTIRFSYVKKGMKQSEIRRVNPMGLSAWQGSWYLVGEDLDREDIRAFKLNRFDSGIEKIGKSGGYEIPKDFSVKEYLVMYQRSESIATIHLRKNQGQNLRALATMQEQRDEEWDVVSIPLDDPQALMREILWSGDDAIVIEPIELRDQIIGVLRKIEAAHA